MLLADSLKSTRRQSRLYALAIATMQHHQHAMLLPPVRRTAQTIPNLHGRKLRIVQYLHPILKRSIKDTAAKNV